MSKPIESILSGEELQETIREAYKISKEIKEAVGIKGIGPNGQPFDVKINAPRGFTKVGNMPRYEYKKEDE